eukprot:5864992-Amphidinium_carterae.1
MVMYKPVLLTDPGYYKAVESGAANSLQEKCSNPHVKDFLQNPYKLLGWLTHPQVINKLNCGPSAKSAEPASQHVR